MIQDRAVEVRLEPGKQTPVGPLRGLGVLLLLGGLVGLIAAGVLLIEKIELLTNPFYVPSCDVDPVLSCGSVMTTPQAEAFGFPNPIIGIAGFPVVATIGATLLAGGTLSRWFWVATQIGATFGVVFVHWLIYQSLYVVGALCPYCMVVWAVTIPIFLYITVANLQLTTTRSARTIRRGLWVVAEHPGAILLLWYGVVIALVVARFWDHWASLV